MGAFHLLNEYFIYLYLPAVTIQEPPRDELKNPFWIEDKELGEGRLELLGAEEVAFWENLIKKYLEPLPDDKIQQEKVTLIK